MQTQAAQLVSNCAVGDFFRVGAGQPRKVAAQISGVEFLDCGVIPRLDRRTGDGEKPPLGDKRQARDILRGSRPLGRSSASGAAKGRTGLFSRGMEC